MNKIFNFDFIKDMSVWERILFLVFLLAQIIVSIVYQSGIVNFILFLANFLYVVLASYKSFWLFIAGIIAPLFLGYICFKNGLYGQAILNLCGFLPLQIIGFLLWLKDLKRDNLIESDNLNNVDVPMRRLNLKYALIIVASFIALFFLVQFGLSKLDAQKMSYADAFVTVGSLMGTILISLRFVENWWLYLVVNIVSSIMWLQLVISGVSDAPSLLVTQIAFVTWTVIGLIKWYRVPKIDNKKDVESK